MKKLFILATAAVAFASCSDSDLVGNIASSQSTEQPQAVQFGTYMGSSATRAGYEGDLTNASIKNSGAGFGVFGYYSEEKTFNAWTNWNPTTPTASTTAATAVRGIQGPICWNKTK